MYADVIVVEIIVVARVQALVFVERRVSMIASLE